MEGNEDCTSEWRRGAMGEQIVDARRDAASPTRGLVIEHVKLYVTASMIVLRRVGGELDVLLLPTNL